MTTAPGSDPVAAVFRPRRAALVVATLVALGLVIDAASPHATFADGVAIVFMLVLAVGASTRLVGLWTGTISHTTIAGPLPYISEAVTQRFRAFTPCAIVGVDGLVVAAGVLFATGGHGAAASALMFAAGGVALVFMAAGLWVALFLRPRILLPGTMRSMLRR